MFDPRKLMDMMKQAADMQQQMQQELKGKVVEGSAGGGMVKVSMNGQFEALTVTIDPQVLNMNDLPFLEDLVRASINDATRQAQELMKGQVSSLASRFGLS